jgi:hypothetical protein
MASQDEPGGLDLLVEEEEERGGCELGGGIRIPFCSGGSRREAASKEPAVSLLAGEEEVARLGRSSSARDALLKF